MKCSGWIEVGDFTGGANFDWVYAKKWAGRAGLFRKRPQYL